jgi:hypothetical protein
MGFENKILYLIKAVRTSSVRSSSVKTDRNLELMNFNVEYRTRKNMLYRKWRSVSEHMNKTRLLPIVASYSAAPEASLVGHPCNRTTGRKPKRDLSVDGRKTLKWTLKDSVKI